MTRVGTAFSNYLDLPAAITLRELHDVTKADDTFSGRKDWHGRVTHLMRRDRHDEVIRTIDQAMRGAFLSPDAHRLMAHALHQIGRADRSRFHMYLATTAVEIIVDSGKRTADSPRRVLHAADEYPVLRELGLRSRSCCMHVDGSRFLDVHQLDDGSEMWFEVIA
ncbi:hypothetical protein [uncultured Tessaracoccus sp.]|uniref:hypothetical protein n=1 Tax=uncultured Tessaracoccus sp. TaxID=905023 RepID=UPI00262FCFBE|nr:hypothetical protein [uncultured Tessaracoccus sp.]